MKRLICALIVSALIAVAILVPCYVFFNELMGMISAFPEAQAFIGQGFWILAFIVLLLCSLLVLDLCTS